MKGPTTKYGQALLERVSEEIRRSELGGKSGFLLFIPISRAMYEAYKEEPKEWDIRLASNYDGIVSIALISKRDIEPG